MRHQVYKLLCWLFVHPYVVLSLLIIQIACKAAAIGSDIEELTLMVISYEIYETSLRRVSQISYKMTMSVRFCLSYDSLKLDFIAFKIDNILIRKRIVDTDVVNDVTYSRQSVIIRVVIRVL